MSTTLTSKVVKPYANSVNENADPASREWADLLSPMGWAVLAGWSDGQSMDDALGNGPTLSNGGSVSTESEDMVLTYEGIDGVSYVANGTNQFAEAPSDPIFGVGAGESATYAWLGTTDKVTDVSGIYQRLLATGDETGDDGASIYITPASGVLTFAIANGSSRSSVNLSHDYSFSRILALLEVTPTTLTAKVLRDGVWTSSSVANNLSTVPQNALRVMDARGGNRNLIGKFDGAFVTPSILPTSEWEIVVSKAYRQNGKGVFF
ncbi:hypothetical protein MLD52_09140 [Puniceicoccaceae bacterium K14]|nr:hypothetical protein [Puniceicoccaceae bacterium K14]